MGPVFTSEQRVKFLCGDVPKAIVPKAQGIDAALIAFRGRLLATQEGGGSIFRTATVRKYTRG